MIFSLGKHAVSQFHFSFHHRHLDIQGNEMKKENVDTTRPR